MRVTQLNSFNRLQRYLNQNREQLAKYQQQLASRKRVTKASDDSVAFTNSRHLLNNIRRYDQYQTNISSGLAKSRSAEDALQSMLDILNKFKTVTINGVSDTQNAEGRKLLADQVESLKKKMVDLGNTKFNGVYLFAGTKTAQSPFSIDSGSPGGVLGRSNNNNLKIQVSDTSTISISVTGKSLRNTGAGDLFEIMQKIGDALRNNNTSVIEDTMDNVNKAYNHVLGLTSTIGNHINRMKFLNHQMKSQELYQKGRNSRLVDADLSNVILNIQKYQTSYQAALAVHSQIIQMSLVNYL